MHFILIVMLSTHPHNMIYTKEFSFLETCNVAKAIVISKIREISSDGIVAECMTK